MSDEEVYKYHQFLNCVPYTVYRDAKLACKTAKIPESECEITVIELLKLGLIKETHSEFGDPNYQVMRVTLLDEPNFQNEILKELKDTYLKKAKDLMPLLLSFQVTYWQTNLDIRNMLSSLNNKKYALFNGNVKNIFGQTNWSSIGSFNHGMSMRSEYELRNAQITGLLDKSGYEYLQSLQGNGFNNELLRKIDKILEGIDRNEMGAEIIYDEIEELKEAISVLNKKNWTQLLKGKLLDLIAAKAAGFTFDAAKHIFYDLTGQSLDKLLQ